jgi:Tfp pilus assembly protein PilN
MITLNFCSEKIKSEVRLKRIYSLISKVGNYLTILVASLSIMLLFARLALSDKLISVAEETTLSSISANNFDKNIKDINSQMAKIELVQKDQMLWQKEIHSLNSCLPDGVKLKELKLDSIKNSISGSGVASSRDLLLQFKGNLEKSENFKKPICP